MIVKEMWHVQIATSPSILIAADAYCACKDAAQHPRRSQMCVFPTGPHLVHEYHVCHLIPAASNACLPRPQPQVVRLVLLHLT